MTVQRDLLREQTYVPGSQRFRLGIIFMTNTEVKTNLSVDDGCFLLTFQP